MREAARAAQAAERVSGVLKRGVHRGETYVHSCLLRLLVKMTSDGWDVTYQHVQLE